MQEKQTVVNVDVADGRARLAISRHVGQFIIRTESLAVGRSPDTAGDVILLAHNIVPNPVDGMDVSRIAREGCHIGHPGIHVSGPHGMPHGLILLHHGLVRLAVSVAPRSVAALVEEELRLVQILLVARGVVQAQAGLILNRATHQCTYGEEEITLTPLEFSILWILTQNRGKVISSENLFEQVWKEKYFKNNNNTVMVHIRHLREKLGEVMGHKELIKTVWGVGYKVEE